MQTKRNINVENKKLTIVRPQDDGSYEVFDGDSKLGTFQFSDGKNGLAGYSNSFGKDMYVVNYVGSKCVYPVYADTQREACEYILKHAA